MNLKLHVDKSGERIALKWLEGVGKDDGLLQAIGLLRISI
jgi:hypothetical protein